MFPFVVSAYGIENFYINGVVAENGDMVIEEYFEVNGEYNGYERIIYYRNDNLYEFDPTLDYYGPSNINNASDIQLMDVRAVDRDRGFNFEDIGGKKFKEVDSADTGDYGVYELNSKYNGIAVKMLRLNIYVSIYFRSVNNLII